MAGRSFKSLLHGARQVVQVTDSAEISVLKGTAMSSVHVLNRKSENEGLSVVVSEDGRIADIDTDAAILDKYADCQFASKHDVRGKVLMPGLVDAHTHPVFAGDRVHEFAMKLAGATYMQVHEAGGGIHFTVEKTRQASEQELWDHFESIAKAMLACGTTLLEAKSGYGLDSATELKMLRVLERAKGNLAMEVSGTFCGAHAIPKGSTAEAAAKNVIEEQIPSLKAEMDAGRLHTENIDVFCEKGVFTVEQTRKILEKGAAEGFRINFHGDELHPTGSAELAAELQATAVSHLEEISERGIDAISRSGTIAVVLPTTAYILRLKPTPVREMISAGVAVALGSDFNPNAYCYAMPMVMHLGCVIFRMSLEEALVASTINAAAALGRGHTHGTLHPGRTADILIVDAARWEHLVYQFGCHRQLIVGVMKRGEMVYEA